MSACDRFEKYIDKARDRPGFECGNCDVRYTLSDRVLRPVTSAHKLQRDEPTTRRLRIFAVDPSASSRDGKITTTSVPYEPLQPGPIGKLFEIENEDDWKRDLARKLVMKWTKLEENVEKGQKKYGQVCQK